MAPVLVVDDRPEVAATLAELVRLCGREAVIAELGGGVGALLKRHLPAAVILDVMMPDEDGYEALAAIARHSHVLPVLLVTGHGDDWLRMGASLGRLQGLTQVQTASKPVRMETLRHFLETIAPE